MSGYLLLNLQTSMLGLEFIQVEEAVCEDARTHDLRSKLLQKYQTPSSRCEKKKKKKEKEKEKNLTADVGKMHKNAAADDLT